MAFLIDTIEFGEVPGIHHGLHDLGMWYWLSLGYTPAGPEVWNAIRALDYLETRPEVDSKRLAVTGISGGGAMTWYTAAVDDRVKVASPVCSTWSVESHTALNAVHENCDCIYFVNTFLADLPSVGALIAPQPLKIISASRDPSFPAAGYHDVYRRTRAIYDLYGAADKVQEYDYAAPHSDILPFRKEADEWLNRWLKNDSTPFEGGQIQREDAATLKVLDHAPADAVNGHIHKIFIKTQPPEPWTSLSSWKARRTRLLAQLRDRTFRAFPNVKVPFQAWKRAPRMAFALRRHLQHRIHLRRRRTDKRTIVRTPRRQAHAFGAHLRKARRGRSLSDRLRPPPAGSRKQDRFGVAAPGRGLSGRQLQDGDDETDGGSDRRYDRVNAGLGHSAFHRLPNAGGEVSSAVYSRLRPEVHGRAGTLCRRPG